jgi:two-component system, NarL family, nitrate/nitrite response regulator NarL
VARVILPVEARRDSVRRVVKGREAAGRTGGPLQRLLVLVLNASPTRNALLGAALDTWDGIRCRCQHEPGAPESAEDVPDVVLVDISTGPRTELGTALLVRKALQLYPSAAVLLLSDNPSRAAGDLVRRFPLSGCVMSSQGLESVASSLKLAHEGVSVIPKGLLDQLRRSSSAAPLASRPRKAAPLGSRRLTGRQSEVANLLMEGLSNKGIAHRLGIAERTVKNHLRNVMAEMGVSSRTQIVLALLDGR